MFNGLEAVPAANSASNKDMREVVGSKLDDESGDSLAAKAYSNEKHIHAVSKVWPSLADGPTVTANAAGWTLGALVEIVAANAITVPFDIHEICVEDLSAVDRYQIVLYYGAGDTECANRKVVKTAVMDGTINVPVRTPIIPANSRVRAALACKSANARTADISLSYHEY